MRIGIVTPAPAGSRYGNRVTALRWASILKERGHRVTVAQEYDGRPYDLLVALHASRSYDSIKRFSREYSQSPIIVALTGTDLYRDLRRDHRVQVSLDLARGIIVLQPKALDELDAAWRKKARVIYQSVESKLGTRSRRQASEKTFDVCVIGHLREVKDPFRAAMAARLLPFSSRIRILQVGGAMSKAMAARARREMKRNPRYGWLGEQPHWRVRQILSRCGLTVLPSKMEGGANFLSEAIVTRVPVLASHIPGNVGILGEDYAGYFTVGDTLGLARMLERAETDAKFLAQLRKDCNKLAQLFNPQREKSAWASLLSELGVGSREKH
jgi:putative glycosyltransferase (TIGR04348 family)